MSLDYKIKEINDSNISALEDLSLDAIADGHHAVEKAIKEWKDGTNSFSRNGEELWGIFLGEKCIGIGGVMQDPFIDDTTVGRVRRVYISTKYRGQGLSKVLLRLVIEKAKENFKTLRLSTHNPVAAHLYESFNFEKKEDEKVTHQITNLKTYILPTK